MNLRAIGRLLMIMGVLAFVLATGWWFLFFQQMLGENVKLASECFYYVTDLCDTVVSIDFFFEIPAYSPALLYLAGAFFAVGLGIVLFAPGDGAETS